MNNIESKETISESRKESFETQMNVYDTRYFFCTSHMNFEKLEIIWQDQRIILWDLNQCLWDSQNAIINRSDPDLDFLRIFINM